MSSHLLAVSVTGALVLATLTACSPAVVQPPDGTPRPSTTPSPTARPVDGSLDEVLARADQVLQLPTTTTPMADLPFVGEPVELPGAIGGISTDGEVLAYVDGDPEQLVRVPLDGAPEPVASFQDVGPASGPHGGASTSPAASEDVVAWLAYHDARDDLNVVDFTVYVAAADGTGHRAVGGSTADIPDQGTGRNVQVPFWRERLTVLDERVYWMERVRRNGDVETLPDFSSGDDLGIAVMSAPVDGRSAQVEVTAGWYHSEDLCLPQEQATLVHLDSALSQAPDTGTATVRRDAVDAEGRSTGTETLWSAPEPTDGAYAAIGAAACAGTVAVAWQQAEREDGTPGRSVVEIAHGGATTVVEIPDDGYATQPVVTEDAVIFATVGGTVDGGVYVLELATGELFRTFQQEGFYDAIHVSRTALAWLDQSVPGADGTYEQVYLAAPFVR